MKTITALLVFCSLVALSTQLKCLTCQDNEAGCKDLKEITCLEADDLCAISQFQGNAKASVFRGCVKPASCKASNTGDVTGIAEEDAKRLKKIFSMGKTKCTPCNTDLCNSGAPEPL